MRSRAPWPQMVIATVLVMVFPAAVVWALSASGVIRSIWAGVVVASVLALVISSAGSAYWRRRATGDVLFSDLLVWGWLRRRRMERRLGRADDLLDQASRAEGEHKDELLGQLGAALDAQDPYLGGHSHRVARYATMIAGRLDLSDEQVERVKAAAAVHDIGKLSIAADVLYKPGRLTDAEFEVMKQHAGEGGEMVKKLGDPALAAAVRSHHERWDGTGYPDGLSGEQIPAEARIISVADTFDAITSARSYRPATAHVKALDVIDEEAGQQLDPAAARAFISCYSDRRGAAMWAGLTSVPRQLAGRLSTTPAQLTSAATAALTAPLIAVAGVAGANALPATQDSPPENSAAALRQAAVASATPGPRTSRASPTPGTARAQVTPTPGTVGSPATPTPGTGADGAGAEATPTPVPSAGAVTGADEEGSPPPEGAVLPGQVGDTAAGRSAPSEPVSAPSDPLVPDAIPPPFPTATPEPTPEPPLPTATPTPEPTTTPEPTPTPPPEPVFPPVELPGWPPHTAEDCKNGGWEELGYPNQGQCIADAVKP
jgi:hypothetical protein